jgi:hypothetical protein
MKRQKLPEMPLRPIFSDQRAGDLAGPTEAYLRNLKVFVREQGIPEKTA